MASTKWSRRVAWGAVLLAGLFCSHLVLSADDKPAADAQQKGATAAQTESEKPKRRLPNHYAAVVTPEQREQIYAIQAEYNAEIDVLLAQIKELEDKRDAAIDATLSAEQLETVAKLKAEAEARKKQRELEKKEGKEPSEESTAAEK